MPHPSFLGWVGMTTVRPATDINAVVASSDNPTAGKFSVYYYDANPSDGEDDANDGNNAVDDDRPTDRWALQLCLTHITFL